MPQLAPAKPHDATASPAADAADGFKALALLLAFTGDPVAPAQLARESGLGARRPTLEALTRLARAHERTGRVVTARWDALAKTALPAVAETRDGFVVLARVGQQGALIHDPAEGRPKTLSQADFEARWTGRLLLVGRAPGGEAPAHAPAARPFGFSWFLPILAKHRAALAQITAASLLLQVFGLFMPLFLMIVMDKVLTSNGVSTLGLLVVGLLAAGVFELLVGLARAHLHAFVSNRLDVELQARLFRHLAALPISFFAASPTGATTARVQDLQAIRAFLTGATVTTLIDLAFTGVYLAVMAWFAPVLTLIVVGVVAAVLLLYAVVTPALKARLASRAGQAADGQSFLIEAVGGIETVKSLAVEPFLQRRWEEHIAHHTRTAFDAERLSQAMGQGVFFLNRLMTVATLWLGALAVMDGTLSAGQLLAFNLMAPAQRLGQLWQQFQQARVSVRRLGDIMNVQREPVRRAATSLTDLRGRVTFERVGFRYAPGGPAVLRGVSFDVQPGEVVGIVGSSGSGKSTIAKLVQQLYPAESGRVLVDGVDLALLDPAWLRRRVGFVMQENVLFNRTVRDNIALADPAAPFERVVEAATLAGAHDFILALPRGYDTVVGERGARLSGGQRQRVALARALVTDPRILILDEATSALDVESERVIHANMRRIAAGRTVFVIAHRLSTVRGCDRILVVEEGAVVEDGPPAALLARGGRYAALWRCQDAAVSEPVADAVRPQKAAGTAGTAGTAGAIPPAAPAAVLEADRDAFAPELVEVAERTPGRTLLWLPSIVLAALLLATAWGALAELEIVSPSPGRVVPSARVKLVQPAEGGVVRAIHVRNGQAVTAGQPVIDLDPTDAGAEHEQLTRRLATARLEAAALRAALEAEPGRDPLALFTPPDGIEAAAVELRRRQLADDWASDRARLAAAEGEVQRLQAARATLAARIAKVAAVLPLLRERVATRAFLVERNLTARSELLKLRQELVESEREEAVLVQQLRQADLDVTQAEERQRQAVAERTGGLLRRLGGQEQEAAALAAELRKAAERQARRTLLAPADGVVTELAVHTLGGVVREAETLLKIVPEDGLLEIEARVRNRDVGFVQPGQAVEVKVDTFAFTRYGTLPGTLVDVAADAAGDDPQNGTYKARIALERDTLRVDGRDVRLQPGMTVTVDIRTGRRRAIEYLLAPMLRMAGEAMRER